MALEINNGISIVICCYNSSKRLPETIKHLSQQIIQDKVPWEIIVVDNKSTDGTKEVAIREIEKYQNLKHRYIIVEEVRAGLTFARKKGCETASHDYILFCDDDNWLNENYVNEVFNLLNTHHDVGAVGAANSIGIYEIEPKQWFLDHRHFCAVFEKSEDSITYVSDDSAMICGAGMGIRREIILNYFSSLKTEISDRKGDSLISGGDTDILYYVIKQKFAIGCFTSLSFKHFIPKQRIDKEYLLKIAYALSFSSVLVARKNNNEVFKWKKLGFIKYMAIIFLKKTYFHASIVYAQFKGTEDAIKNNTKKIL